jgi:hypothetical protein
MSKWEPIGRTVQKVGQSVQRVRSRAPNCGVLSKQEIPQVVPIARHPVNKKLKHSQ